MTVPVSNVTATLTDNQIAYTVFGMNVKNVAAHSDSSLVRLRVNDNTKFRIDLDGNIQFPQTIWIPSRSMTPSLTLGASPYFWETTTSKLTQSTMLFDHAESQSAEFDVLMPSSWNKGSLKYRIVFMPDVSGSGTQVSYWKLQSYALSNADLIDPVVTTSTYITASGDDVTKIYTSDYSAAFTVDGSPQSSDIVLFKLTRESTNVLDTLPQFIRLFGIELLING